MINSHTKNLNGSDILVLSPTPTYPLDYGNRKRIYATCQQLRERGAKIHFLHYPFEWGTSIPSASMQKMAQQWDSFYLIPPTRELHQQAQGEDHTIDEWWDEAIGDYLKWLFSRRYFDALIVNYTYLSKAFEFAPKHVYRILDTHDKFTDRRNLLESQGISAEFFHTTQEQEAIALGRADLVWAIKEQEADFFRTIANTPVLTMPFIEPQQWIKRNLTIADKDYLVIGLLGARNNVNITNTRRFIEEILPKFCQYLAPIKIKLAGSMCDDLGDLANLTGVEIIGRVKNINDFYSAIDAVVLPMTFSTGLKIKAVEALTKGLPIIAHKHGMEGIPTNHSHHLFESLDAMGEYLIDLAFERHLVKKLTQATHLTYLQMRSQVEEAMDATALPILTGRPLTVITINEQFFDKSSAVHQHTVQTIYYLKHLTELVYYVDTPINSKAAKAFEWHNLIGKVVISPDAARASSIANNENSEELVGTSFSVLTLEELCHHRQVTCLWLLSVPQELQKTHLPSLKNLSIYVRTDVLRNSKSGDTNLEKLVNPLQVYNQVTLVNCTLSALTQDKYLAPKANINIVPYWRETPWQVKDFWQSVPHQDKQIITLASHHTISVVYDFWQMWLEVFPSENKPLMFVPDWDKNNLELDKQQLTWEQDREFISAINSASDLLHNFQQWDKQPKFVIDFSGDNLVFAAYRETLKRIGVVQITPDGSKNSKHRLLRGDSYLKPSSMIELMELVKKLLTHSDYLHQLEQMIWGQVASEYASDAGWSRIWRELAVLKKTA